MNDVELTQRAWSLLTIPLAGAVVVLGFTVTPLLRFAAPSHLAWAGLIFSVGIVATYLCSLFNFKEPYWWITSMVTFAGIVGLFATCSDAIADSDANDRRCLALQRDMISSLPVRSDSAELFQTLACRPQGPGSVFASRDPNTASSKVEQDMRRDALPYRGPPPLVR